MSEHRVEDHAKVYLTLVDGAWEVDHTSADGYPLDGLEGGAQCVGDNGDHGRSCDAVNNIPDLPNLEQLYVLIGSALSRW